LPKKLLSGSWFMFWMYAMLVSSHIQLVVNALLPFEDLYKAC